MRGGTQAFELVGLESGIVWAYNAAGHGGNLSTNRNLGIEVPEVDPLTGLSHDLFGLWLLESTSEQKSLSPVQRIIYLWIYYVCMRFCVVCVMVAADTSAIIEVVFTFICLAFISTVGRPLVSVTILRPLMHCYVIRMPPKCSVQSAALLSRLRFYVP